MGFPATTDMAVPSHTTSPYRDQYSGAHFAPYTAGSRNPGFEKSKYEPYLTAYEARIGEIGGSHYNHRPVETGWVSGPYGGHDPRHGGVHPGPHEFNAGYNHIPEKNVELRRPFCGMTPTRTQKCSPLQESMRLVDSQRRVNHEFLIKS